MSGHVPLHTMHSSHFKPFSFPLSSLTASQLMSKVISVVICHALHFWLANLLPLLGLSRLVLCVFMFHLSVCTSQPTKPLSHMSDFSTKISSSHTHFFTLWKLMQPHCCSPVLTTSTCCGPSSIFFTLQIFFLSQHSLSRCPHHL